jgi:hypothetical protein
MRRSTFVTSPPSWATPAEIGRSNDRITVRPIRLPAIVVADVEIKHRRHRRISTLVEQLAAE